jgi:hypothetical protein
MEILAMVIYVFKIDYLCLEILKIDYLCPYIILNTGTFV